MSTTPLRFGFLFLVGFALLMGGFEAVRGTAFERFVVETMILKPTAGLIDLVTPGEHVELVGRTLVSPDGANLRVTRGCEGIEMFLMLVAAVGAFPTKLRRRAYGLLLGAALAYVLSVTRLMALHYILRYSPGLWEVLHGLILPLGPVAVMALFFMLWSSGSGAGAGAAETVGPFVRSPVATPVAGTRATQSPVAYGPVVDDPVARSAVTRSSAARAS